MLKNVIPTSWDLRDGIASESQDLVGYPRVNPREFVGISPRQSPGLLGDIPEKAPGCQSLASLNPQECIFRLSKIESHCRLGGCSPQRPQKRRSFGTPGGQPYLHPNDRKSGARLGPAHSKVVCNALIPHFRVTMQQKNESIFLSKGPNTADLQRDFVFSYLQADWGGCCGVSPASLRMRNMERPIPPMRRGATQ